MSKLFVLKKYFLYNNIMKPKTEKPLKKMKALKQQKER